ncbi:hypothetical protein ACA910_000322 [Epithemia clementina (nom. ined.)]
MARPAVDDGNNSVPANVPLLPPDSTLEQDQQRQPEAGQPQQQQQPSFMQTLMRLELVLILLVTFLAALSPSGGVGVVPNTIADRYARLHHNYTGPDCGSIVDTVKPEACQAGTDDAQIAATWSQVGVSIFGLLVNPVVGSWSDVLGRRIPIMMSFLVGSLSAFLFFCTIVTPRMDPIWYYLSFSLAGGFQYLGLVFAALSDLVPEAHRTGCFGVMIAMAYGGFAIGPSVPLFLNHKQTALFSAVLSITNVVIAALFFPETLSMDIRDSNRQRRQAEFAASSDDSTESTSNWMNVSHRTCSSILEPIRDMAVVNRDWSTRLIAVGTVISSMIFASDATLVIYYIQQHFDVDDGDIASMFLSLGIVGLLLQGSLQPLAKALGEANLLIITFVCGSLHNLLYGLAKSKQTIFVAIVLSQVTKLNLPVLSSLGSKQVSETVQGRIQGALSACGSMGAALGPLSMEFVYHHTKNKSRFGPGFMFVYASALYMFGAFMMALIPRTSNRPHNISDACSGTETVAHAPTRSGEDSAREEENDTAADTLRTVNSDLEEPLLEQHD